MMAPASAEIVTVKLVAPVGFPGSCICAEPVWGGKRVSTVSIFPAGRFTLTFTLNLGISLQSGVTTLAAQVRATLSGLVPDPGRKLIAVTDREGKQSLVALSGTVLCLF